MAVYRNVSLSFWDDTKIVDNFSPEDKYFMLYCLTNTHTNLLGCYEISVKQMSLETGYTVETIDIILERFQNNYKNIMYDKSTKELFILNWYKYNWNASFKLDQPLLRDYESVKSSVFKPFLYELLKKRDTLCIPYPYPMDTTDTVSVSVTVSDTVTDSVKEIISYLNQKAGTEYKDGTKSTASLISARLKEGFTVQNFKTVIDKKCADWKGTDFSKYLRPCTLFAPSKFESYLNEQKSTGRFDKLKKNAAYFAAKEASNDSNRNQ